MNKATLPSLESRSSVWKNNLDLLLQNAKISVGFNKSLGRKLKRKQEVIDKWKQKYDEEHKLIKTLRPPVRSLSMRERKPNSIPFLVSANRKSIHFTQHKPKMIDFRITASLKGRISHGRGQQLQTPRKWETIEEIREFYETYQA